MISNTKKVAAPLLRPGYTRAPGLGCTLGDSVGPVSSTPQSPILPADAVVAMRSWPRRYRAALLPVDDEETIERTGRMGPQGVSALDLATDSVRTWALLGRALHDITIADSPVLHPAVTDPAARHWEASVHEPLQSILDQIDDGAAALADAFADLPAADWKRTAIAAGGVQVSALDIAAEAVRVGTDNLRQIESVLAALS